ncbi:hydrogen peroxide-dependent heme synthase [Microbacterium gorillae]|uniref:hydrogen peroxide-dependent heme synthase n=1 Tax=Microbacterium gorillae TaxID=1231063 RepID=UPI00058E0D0D|nr:hydrogen peroxide-dependent heme synthase [Microbacterium gorillae]
MTENVVPLKPVVDHRAVAESINAAVNYTLYAAFTATRLGGGTPDAVVQALTAVPESVTVRGTYDVSGFRADAEVLIWLHGPIVEDLQAVYRAVVDAADGALEPVWTGVGVHRTAEFNRGHVPAFLAGDAPKGYICLYPFVRSYEWYLLPEDERRKMLRDHGAAAKDYGDVLANTVSSFALGDYEWLLSFEADDLIRIVDLMRDLRATEARRHVREEVPFFTGPRVAPEELFVRFL